MPESRRILLVDDDRSIRQRVRQLLEEELPSAIIDEAGSAEQALSSIVSGTPDVLVLDVRLGADNGIELISRAHALRPDLPVIVLSALPEAPYAAAALKAGARAYIPKNRLFETLAPTVCDLLGLVSR